MSQFIVFMHFMAVKSQILLTLKVLLSTKGQGLSYWTGSFTVACGIQEVTQELLQISQNEESPLLRFFSCDYNLSITNLVCYHDPKTAILFISHEDLFEDLEQFNYYSKMQQNNCLSIKMFVLKVSQKYNLQIKKFFL